MTRTLCLVLCLVALGAAASQEDRSARSAQCRAMCLDEYHIGKTASHTKCLQNEACFMCWEKCHSLHTVLTAKFIACDRLPDCAAGGCQKACQFHSSPPAAPRVLSLWPARLEVQFGWSEARWTVTEDETAPRHGSIVYLLLARAGDEWKELVQTPEESVVLINVAAGTRLRLLALTRLGLLTATEAVFEPTEPDRLVLDVQDNQLAGDPHPLRLDTYQIEIPGAWLLETVSVARDANMVLAEVSWERQTLGPDEYLVTWEVSGGGIKGHLYTDITSVTLSLWPESIYNIQVELMSPAQGVEPVRSVPLVISTYSVVTGRSMHKVPCSALAGRPTAVRQRARLQTVGLLLAALLLACFCCGLALLVRWRFQSAAAAAAPARCLLAVSRRVSHKYVASPLEGVAIADVHTGSRV